MTPVGVLVRDAQLVRVVAADRDEDRVEALALEVVEGEVPAECLVADDLPAESGDRLVLGLEDLDLGQAVLGDPVAEHPAGRRVALEDGHVVTGQEQVVGRAHPGRAGADDGRPPPALRLRLERQRRVDVLVEHRLEDLVAGVAMAVADGDRLVDLVAPAVLLAGRRADPAEDAREGDRPLEDPGRLAPVALGVLLEEARDVDVAGALVLAGRQAVGVVVAEDQLEVRRPQPADLLGLGLDLHAGLGRPRAADRRVAPRPRPRRRTSGRRRSRAASARSTGSGSRSRCRGRPRGWSGPRGPRRPGRRPRSGSPASDCGRCGDWVVSSRSASDSGSSGGFGSGDQVGHQAPRVAAPAGGHRDRVADAGRTGAAEEVVVDLGTEVSHRARCREGRQALVVAQGGPADVCREVGGQVERRSAAGVPTAIRSTTSDSRRVPIRQGIVLPQAWSAQNRVSSRARSTMQARSSATTIEPEPMWAPAARSASKVYGVSSTSAGRNPPDGPPTRIALSGRPPGAADEGDELPERASRAAPRRRRPRRPRGPGRGSCPGCPEPRSREGSGPWRMIQGTAARVWTFWTTVGRPNRPRSVG